jgi:adenine-specific DNA methylase
VHGLNVYVDSGSEPLTLHLEEDYRESISFHRWFAMRRMNAARAAVAFTTSPEWLSDPDKLALVSTGDDAAIASALAENTSSRRSKIIGPRSAVEGKRLLDLCAGIGTVGAMASRLGFDAVSVELSVVPHLIDRVLHEFAVSLAKPAAPTKGTSGKEYRTAWRGFAAELEDFANAVWRGARERLNVLFEERCKY